MRQAQQNKRMRGRNRKGPNPLTRSYESNGPDVKIRGTALHIAEKYAQLARDAQASGDRVAGENYLQHAEHYYRIVAAAQAQMPQPQPVVRSDDDSDGDEDRETAPAGGNGSGERQPNRQGGPQQQPAFGLSDPQPYVNGNGRDTSGGDSAEASGQQDSTRADQRDNRERNGEQGSGFRPRRRRAYRDRHNENRDGGGSSGEGAAQAATPTPAPAEVASPPGDD